MSLRLIPPICYTLDLFEIQYDYSTEKYSIVLHKAVVQNNLVSLTEQTGTLSPFTEADFENIDDIDSFNFVDIDKDGDLDLFVDLSIDYTSKFTYFKNTGTATAPKFQMQTTSPFDHIDFYFSGNGFCFVDLEKDGDFDFVAGVYDSYQSIDTYVYIKNNGTANVPTFELQEDSNNPFLGIEGEYPSFADLDNDGDFDFISNLDGRFTYYKNTGTVSSPSFEEQTGNSNLFEQFGYIYAEQFVFSDVDGDGDLDMVVNGYYNILYYENTGSKTAAQFTDQNGIDLGYYGGFPELVDIDGDGDIDVIYGSYSYNYENETGYYEIRMYRNTGTATKAVFGNSELLYSISLPTELIIPKLVDIDADGDWDMFYSSYDGSTDVWKQTFLLNTGSKTNPQFSERTGAENPLSNLGTIVNDDYILFISFVDIDKDGDYDLFAGGEENLYYLKNTGTKTAPKFETATNPLDLTQLVTGLDYARYANVAFTDLDGDGDFDAFVGAGWKMTNYEESYEIKFFQNTGTATSPQFIEKTGADNPFAAIELYIPDINFADMDSDGDKDCFITPVFDSKLYFENISNINTSVRADIAFEQINVYPNPAKNSITVNCENSTEINIYSIDGKLVLQKAVQNPVNELNISTLTDGIYMLKVVTDKGTVTRKLVKE